MLGSVNIELMTYTHTQKTFVQKLCAFFSYASICILVNPSLTFLLFVVLLSHLPLSLLEIKTLMCLDLGVHSNLFESCPGHFGRNLY